MNADNMPSQRSWQRRVGQVRLAFVGRCPGEPESIWATHRDSAPSSSTDRGPHLSWATQVHSNTVLAAKEPGPAGEGDALVATDRNLALMIVTADCVPILLTDGNRIAAVHGGWRGLASEILSRTLESFERPEAVDAFIGPAIGPCCYEVGSDVAAAVARVSGSAAIVPGDVKPHLDLVGAAEQQLLDSQVQRIERVGPCTQCHPDQLWSYRRQGMQAGRNLSFIWFES